MAELPRLRVGLTLDSATFVRETNRVIDAVNNMSGRLQRQNRDMTRSLLDVERGVSQIAGAFRALGAAVGIASFGALTREVIQTADAFTQMGARLRLVTDSAEEAAAVQRELIQISIENRASIEDTNRLFQRLSFVLTDMGAKSAELVDITRIVGQAVKLGGANAQEAAAGVQQFAQAMGAGALAGDELRSVRENVIGLAKAIADGLGVPIGRLKELGAAGELTTERVLNALLKQAPQIERDFAQIPVTVGDAMTQVRNSLQLLVGDSDQATGSTRDLAAAISEMAAVLSSPEFVTGFQRFITEFLQRAAEFIATTRREWELLVGAFKAGQDFLAGFGLATPQSLEAISDRIGQINEELAESIRLGREMEAGPGLAVNTSTIAALRAERAELVKRRNDLQFGTAATVEATEAEGKLAKTVKTTAITLRGTTGVIDEVAAKRTKGIQSLQVEVIQLSRLNDAYAKGAQAVRDAEVAIEAHNLIRQLGIEADSEQARIITKEIDLRRQLKDSISEQSEELDRQRKLVEKVNVGGDEGAERQLAALRLTHRQDEEAKRQAENATKVTEDAFSNMLESIQTEFTSTFAEMTKGGIRSFEDIADAATDIFANLSANIASLAIFDPTRFKNLAAQSGVSPGLLGAAGFAPPLIGGTLGLLGANKVAEGFGMGSGLGAGIGALAGSFIPGIGTAAGAIFGGLGGGALGGLFGGLFGGGPTGSQLAFGQGALGTIGLGGTNEASGFIRDLDQSILSALTVRQEKMADQLLRDARSASVQFGDEGPSANDLSRLAAARIAPTARALGFNATGIAGRGRTPEQQMALLNEAIQLERTIEDLTGRVTPFKRALTDLRTSFEEAEARAKQFGISTRGMGRALRQAENELRAQRRLERDQLKLQLQQTIAAGNSALGLKVAIAAIRLEFDQLAESAEDLGVSVRLVRRAERAAVRQARDAAREAARAEQDQRRAEAQRRAAERASAAEARARAAEERVRERAAALATFRELTSTGTDVEREIAAVNQRFIEFRPIAREYGLSIAALNKAQLRITREIAAAAREAAVANFRALTGDEFSNEIDRINATFREARGQAKEYGLSIAALNQAQLEATRAVERRRQAELDAMALSVTSPFEALSDPLRNFARELEASLLSPLELFEFAKADFERTAQAARAGDLAAIEALDEAGRAFIEQAGRFGASPAQADAIRQVQRETELVMDRVEKAQSDASKGIEDAIALASRREVDKLSELVAEVRLVVSAVKQGNRR